MDEHDMLGCAALPTRRPMTTGLRRNPERLSAWILAGIAVSEGAWVALNFAMSPSGFLKYSGFAPGGTGTAGGWVSAAIVAALFVWFSARLPSVRANLLRPSFLKVLALAVAVAAGFLEEIIFRKWLMDYLSREEIGPVLQILASGLAFGLAHGIWGLMGRSAQAAIGATVVTGVLGTALAIVYVAADRSVAPCIVAHFLINVFVEPGLVLAATRGEMGRR
jgi:membrane protease YdiL (CAAX protease family)